MALSNSYYLFITDVLLYFYHRQATNALLINILSSQLLRTTGCGG